MGTVETVTLRDDNTAVVSFDTDNDVVLTTGTRAAVRYLNLVGDRYLELLDGPGSTRVLARGAQTPDRISTQPALDLDLLLGGLKPVIRGLDPRDVNALTNALLQIFQGQGDTMQSLLSKTSSFSNTLADNNAALGVSSSTTSTPCSPRWARRASGSPARSIEFERLTTELADDRDTIGTAIESLSNGTASIADLLTNVRPPLAGTVDQLNRLAPLVDQDKGLHRRCATEGAGELPQARQGRILRKLRQLLPVRHQHPRHRSCRAAPPSSPGSNRETEGARSPNAQVPQPQTDPRRGSSASSSCMLSSPWDCSLND